MNNDQNNSCRHCGSRMPKNIDSKICRDCRFDGHREFGDCPKCDKKNSDPGEK